MPNTTSTVLAPSSPFKSNAAAGSNDTSPKKVATPRDRRRTTAQFRRGSPRTPPPAPPRPTCIAKRRLEGGYTPTLCVPSDDEDA